MEPTIRPARSDDAGAVRAFATDTWPEHGGDYLPSVFESWVRDDGPTARTLVADVEGRAVGLLRTVLLTPDEAWCGGLRVDPDYRGEGIARRLTQTAFDWAGERGATVARAMVFSWNAAGLGVARAVGFEPVTEFRWVHPEPAAETERGDHDIPEPDDAWNRWRGSGARDHLDGLTLDPHEPWALSTLTREGLVDAADDGRVFAVTGGGRGARAEAVQGFAVRVRVTERRTDGGEDPERWAEYGVADWSGVEAAAAVLDAVSRDAAASGVDRTRVLIPETVRAVSDAAAARVEIADAPDFVLAADVTG